MGPGGSSGWLLGVDFGTSNTAAGHVNEITGAVQALPLTHNGNLMPSSVFVSSPSQIDVGDVALNKASVDPAGFIAAPKRLLTLGQSTFQVGEMTVPAHTVAAGVLRSVLARAQQQHEGRMPSGLVLTHPENWSAQQVRVLTDAARELGFPPQLVRTVSEPRAAAHYYARSGEVEPGERVAVFDFGGGTLDVAVLAAARDGSFDVVAAQGDNALGGRNFDAAIRRWVDGELSDRNPRLLQALESQNSVRDLRSLEDSIRNAKEVLSESPQASIDVFAGGEHEVLSLTRGEFDGLIEREVTRGVELARATFRGAGMDGDALRAIYLTGGSSRIPMVHQQMRSLGPIATLDDPKTVVAQGALISAMAHGPTAPPSRPGTPRMTSSPQGWNQPPSYGDQWNRPAQQQPQWAPPPPPMPIAGAPTQQHWSGSPHPARPARQSGSKWAWIAAAAVVVVAGVVAVAVLANGGSTNPPAAPGTSAGAATSTGAAATAGKSTSEALLAALPAALHSGSTCVPARDQSQSAQGITQMTCTIPANTALLAGLTKYADIDQDFLAWIDTDPAKVVSEWRHLYAKKIVEDDTKFIAADDGYDPTFVGLYYENLTNGLHIEFDGFSSRANAQTFLNRAGL